MSKSKKRDFENENEFIENKEKVEVKKVSIKIKNHLKPKTPNQENYIINIAEKDVIICTGVAGTGKTFIAASMACQYLSEGEVDKIVLTRPMVQTGNGLGFLPGTLSEKVNPYLTPLLEEIDKVIGKQQSMLAMQNGVIEIIPLELMRGRNFHNTFMILDEAQNCTYEQIKMFLTRMGRNSICVICGDIKQTDLKVGSLGLIIEKLKGLEDIGIVEMTIDDIVRNDLIGKILFRLEA